MSLHEKYDFFADGKSHTLGMDSEKVFSQFSAIHLMFSILSGDVACFSMSLIQFRVSEATTCCRCQSRWKEHISFFSSIAVIWTNAEASYEKLSAYSFSLEYVMYLHVRT